MKYNNYRHACNIPAVPGETEKITSNGMASPPVGLLRTTQILAFTSGVDSLNVYNVCCRPITGSNVEP